MFKSWFECLKIVVCCSSLIWGNSILNLTRIVFADGWQKKRHQQEMFVQMEALNLSTLSF